MLPDSFVGLYFYLIDKISFFTQKILKKKLISYMEDIYANNIIFHCHQIY